jgi:hypothetical protein
MVPPKLAAMSVASTAANAAHAELSNFIELRSPGIVEKRPDTTWNFEGFLKTVDLQKTNALVTDFLEVSSVPQAFSQTQWIPSYLRGYRMQARDSPRNSSNQKTLNS